MKVYQKYLVSIAGLIFIIIYVSGLIYAGFSSNPILIPFALIWPVLLAVVISILVVVVMSLRDWFYWVNTSD